MPRVSAGSKGACVHVRMWLSLARTGSQSHHPGSLACACRVGPGGTLRALVDSAKPEVFVRMSAIHR